MAPRHLLSIGDLTTNELKRLITSGEKYQKNIQKWRSNKNVLYDRSYKPLSGQLVAMLFTKRSTRTRISTEGAINYFGGQGLFLSPNDIQLGVNESLRDTSKVISSMTAGIVARVDKHSDILEIAKYSSVPVINALCDKYHPFQCITDLLTIKNRFNIDFDNNNNNNNNINKLKLTWVGDANNVLNDLALGAVMLGINVAVATPHDVKVDPEIFDKVSKIATKNNCDLIITHDPIQAVSNSNIIVTDTWISMGQEKEREIKLKQFSGFQINKQLLSNANVNKDFCFMHCLPRHSEEVTDDIFYSSNSVVFQEAENRLYAALAVLDEFLVNRS